MMMAGNGAAQSRLELALAAVGSQKVDFEQVASLIADTDVASESAAPAQSNILAQSEASTVSLANPSANTLLKLTQG